MMNLTFRMSVISICLVAISTVVRGDEDSGDGASRPNILLIMCDDMGFSDIGCYGGEIATPNLDSLAQRGMRFRTFYNNAKCEHTRASLLTGRWWHQVGAAATVVYQAKTFGERMRELGYRTLMSGKWHAGETPYQRGFDRYYGLTDGCCNFWNPGHARPGEPEPAKKRVRRWANDSERFLPFTPPDTSFYTTDVFTDYAVRYLEEYRDEQKPFLLYLAYTAPHYPLHASQEDVAKYRGRYLGGWDRLRKERFERQQQLGILPPNAVLAPRDEAIPAWSDVPEADRDQWDLRMATYAAMIDRMDRNIGRLLETLKETGKLDNTVIFFLSDNGACPDSKDRSTVNGSMPWEVTSYLTQGKAWANASNTPYQYYKTTDYEGGIRTPMIACWPNRIEPGTMTDFAGHLIDFMPTFLDLAGGNVGDELPGRSLVSVLDGENATNARTLYWQFGAARAVRDGDWKAVQKGKEPWELYNLAEDPVEVHDLSSAQPERLAALKADWSGWWDTKRIKPVLEKLP